MLGDSGLMFIGLDKGDGFVDRLLDSVVRGGALTSFTSCLATDVTFAGFGRLKPVPDTSRRACKKESGS